MKRNILLLAIPFILACALEQVPVKVIPAPTVTPVITPTPESVNTATPYLHSDVQVRIGEITEADVNLRACYNTDSEVLMILHQGDDVFMGDVKHTPEAPCRVWQAVTFYDLDNHEFMIGWVCKRYIEEK